MNNQEKIEPVVAYLGPQGTFCEIAARKYFSKAVFIPCPNINYVFTTVERGEADNGVVPVENSTNGSVRATLDRFLESKMMVYGEVVLKIIHNLIARPNIKMSQIKVILSHTQALAQCRRFLESTFLNVELKEVSSTAKAVELLRSVNNSAAIGNEVAADRHGMVILKRDIGDEQNNFTRFFIIGENDAKPTDRDKTSIVFSTKHVPGSLYRVLEGFAVRNINLTKIESRPERKKPWSYVFYLDFEGHRNDVKSQDALNSIKKRCIYIKVLGSYPSA